RDDPRARHRGPRGLDPDTVPHDPGRARRVARRDGAVQGPPADGPPPADRQGNRPVPVRLGEGPRGARREEGRLTARKSPRGRWPATIIDDRWRPALNTNPPTSRRTARGSDRG